MKIRKLDAHTFTYKVDFSNIPAENWDEIFDWCVKTYGPPYENSVKALNGDTPKWFAQLGGVRFEYKEHAQWFVLRFSSAFN